MIYVACKVVCTDWRVKVCIQLLTLFFKEQSLQLFVGQEQVDFIGAVSLP